MLLYLSELANESPCDTGHPNRHFLRDFCPTHRIRLSCKHSWCNSINLKIPLIYRKISLFCSKYFFPLSVCLFCGFYCWWVFFFFFLISEDTKAVERFEFLIRKFACKSQKILLNTSIKEIRSEIITFLFKINLFLFLCCHCPNSMGKQHFVLYLLAHL